MTTARRRRARAGALAVLAQLALWAAPAAVPSPAAGAEPVTAAVMVHLYGAPSPRLPADAAELRAATLDLTAAVLQSRGVTVAARSVTEDLVRRHVVRTGNAFGPSFLADLAAGAGAGVLVAVSLHVEGERLAASARAIATADGTLLGISFAEAGAADGDWRAALTAALRNAVPQVDGAGDGPLLMVLPTRSVGLGPEASRVATAGLLAAVLADGRWRPLDPALVAGAAAEAGCDLERLDKRARAVLRERCGVDLAVAPEIVSFTEAGRANTAPEAVEAAAAGRRGLAEFTLNLRLLDLRTGLLGGTSSTHLEGGPVHGWFGRVHDPDELTRIRTTAGRAWSRFHGFLKEKAS